MIFNITGGGGSGAALNFNVVTYPTEEAMLAAAPSENTIGVITDTPMTSWAFSSTEPSPAEAGMVWISTGTSSTAEFNALKKNKLQVYPISAKQYISGAWVDKVVQIYQVGEWGVLRTCLYNSGDECVDITGGWQGRALKAEPSYSAVAPTVTKNANSITAKVTNGGGVLEVKKDIDLTNVKKLFFDVSGINRPANYNGLAVIVFDRSLTSTGNDSSTADGYYAKCKAFCMFPVGGTAGEYSLDVSSITGLNDIGIHMYHASGSAGITLNKMWMTY